MCTRSCKSNLSFSPNEIVSNNKQELFKAQHSFWWVKRSQKIFQFRNLTSFVTMAIFFLTTVPAIKLFSLNLFYAKNRISVIFLPDKPVFCLCFFWINRLLLILITTWIPADRLTNGWRRGKKCQTFN